MNSFLSRRTVVVEKGLDDEKVYWLLFFDTVTPLADETISTALLFVSVNVAEYFPVEGLYASCFGFEVALYLSFVANEGILLWFTILLRM